MAFLAMILDGPMQSWGYQSLYRRRTTLMYPTRSGVLGLVCAAIGVDRDDKVKLTEFQALKMTTYTFGHPEVMVDFHTIGGSTKKGAGDAGFLLEAGGGPPGGTVTTNRSYLQNARFGVVFEGDKSILDEIEAGLINPRWGVWFGRKCCLPTMPIFQGRFPTQQEAENHLQGIKHPSEDSPRPLTRRIDEVSGNSSTHFVQDVPLDFKGRVFGSRFVDETHC